MGKYENRNTNTPYIYEAKEKRISFEYHDFYQNRYALYNSCFICITPQFLQLHFLTVEINYETYLFLQQHPFLLQLLLVICCHLPAVLMLVLFCHLQLQQSHCCFFHLTCSVLFQPIPVLLLGQEISYDLLSYEPVIQNKMHYRNKKPLKINQASRKQYQYLWNF